MSLEGKVAIVTGGSRDIGRAISICLAKAGARVAINYCNSEADAMETEAAIVAAGGTCFIAKADLTKDADAAELVAATRARWGDAIDVLVNVTGGLVARKSLNEMDDAFFSHVLRLNVLSTFAMTHYAAPHMPSGSAIVNFSSQAGRDGGGPGAAAYATAKGAIMSFTRAMAKELGPKGVRVNALCPGMISTRFHDEFTRDEVRKNVAAATPLRREGQAAEIAEAVLFLVSGASSFVHGANLDINGGSFMS